MVCIYFYFLTWKNRMKSLQGFDYTKQLFLNYWILILWSCQLTVVEINWFSTLTNHCSYMVIASIRMDKKRLLKSSYSNKVSQVTVCLISSNAFCSKSANLNFTLFGVSVVKGCSNWVQYHQGGRHLLRGCLPSPSTSSKYYQQHRSGGARPKAPGRPVGQSQGRPTRYWLDPNQYAGGQWRFTVTDSWGQTQHQAETEGWQMKGRAWARR